MEAQGFRDSLSRFEEKNVAVVGVSPDPPSDLCAFRDKFDLTFPLLADEGAQTAMRYGVWRERERDGRRFMGIVRTTFIIDARGYVERVFHPVDPNGHVEEVLAAL